ncbi:hypothetical protein WN944_000998 [Citrus x changshan-huyou]|uniref:Uncharacterized protein n=1 Tax=Citrus x changshan-huyou TaxID=2935761 RepID=A0AAP0MGE2_9ROSI
MSCTPWLSMDDRYQIPVENSAYNTILWKHWLHYMEAVPSTLHQVVRCVSLTGRGLFDIKRNQMMAKQCYSIAIKPYKGTLGSEHVLGDKKKPATKENVKTFISEHVPIQEYVHFPQQVVDDGAK